MLGQNYNNQVTTGLINQFSRIINERQQIKDIYEMILWDNL